MRRSRRLALLLTVLPAALPAQGAGQLPVELTGGRTEIRLNTHLLTDVGISIRGAAAITGPIEGHESTAMAFSILESSVLELALPSGSYRGPVAGFLVHDGGFELEWPGDYVSLVGFELHPGLPPNAFELRATDGSLIFVLDNPHPQPNSDGTEYLFLDMDLRLSGQLAERLGRPGLEGLSIGEAHVRARRADPAQAVRESSIARRSAGSAGPCVADFDGPVDVLLESMTSVDEAYHDEGNTKVALAPAVRLQNVGTADVPWFRSIAPDGWGSFTVVGQHPLLVMHMYRLANGRIEQIGLSDAKHAFFSANTPPCACQSDQVLFNNCTDLYGAGTNANRQFLAPREEITAATGAWTSTGSHFDGPLPDDLRGHDSSDHLDSFTHRLSVEVPDLETVGAEYRVEAWYVVQGDVDIFNSMGHRAVVPTAPAPGNPWMFPFDDAALTLGSVLDVWVDPSSPPPGAANVRITTAITENDWEGVEVEVEVDLKLAVKTAALPMGVYRYDYALMNFDFDRQIDSFSVPLPPGTLVQNTWFSDVDTEPANDWIVTVNATDINWQAPAGNALDWGTLFNFFFEADAPPGDLPVTLGVLEPGEPGEPATLSALAVAPATFSEIEVVLAGSGAGRVVSTPAGIDCAGDCVEVLPNTGWLELSATPTAGSAFVRWEEGEATVSRDLGFGFAVDGDRDLIAVFETCQADVTLDPQVVTSPEVFHACESLAAGTGFEVESQAIFRAGQSIILGDGFVVAGSGSFRAEIVLEQSVPTPD